MHRGDRSGIRDVGLNEERLRSRNGQFARDSGSGFGVNFGDNNLCVLCAKAPRDRGPNSLARSRHYRNFSVKPSWHFLAEGKDQWLGGAAVRPKANHMMNMLY
jgi:hypothetical protein